MIHVINLLSFFVFTEVITETTVTPFVKFPNEKAAARMLVDQVPLPVSYVKNFDIELTNFKKTHDGKYWNDINGIIDFSHFYDIYAKNIRKNATTVLRPDKIFDFFTAADSFYNRMSVVIMRFNMIYKHWTWFEKNVKKL